MNERCVKYSASKSFNKSPDCVVYVKEVTEGHTCPWSLQPFFLNRPHSDLFTGRKGEHRWLESWYNGQSNSINGKTHFLRNMVCSNKSKYSYKKIIYQHLWIYTANALFLHLCSSGIYYLAKHITEVNNMIHSVYVWVVKLRIIKRKEYHYELYKRIRYSIFRYVK